MSEYIMIAVVGAIINMILALLIPCLLKDTQMPLLENIKKVYATHKQVIITSSIIVFITIYLALKVTPVLGLTFDNDSSLSSPIGMPSNRLPSNEIQSILRSMPNSDFKVINLSRL
jgi:hypothetical protein